MTDRGGTNKRTNKQTNIQTNEITHRVTLSKTQNGPVTLCVPVLVAQCISSTVYKYLVICKDGGETGETQTNFLIIHPMMMYSLSMK